MGLDIYAGTLTRYYSGEWETQVQKWARENGYEFDKIDQDGNKIIQEEVDFEELSSAISAWQGKIAELLAQNEIKVSFWNDDAREEYFTDKPDWDAYGALLLFTAAMIQKTEFPAKVKKGHSYIEEAVVVKQMEAQQPGLSMFARSELWLPFDEVFCFYYHNPFEKEMMISTIGCLEYELDYINKLKWNANHDEIMLWSQSEGYPVDLNVANGIVEKGQVTGEYDVESLAKFAYSIFYQAMIFAKEQQVALILDY